MKVQILILALGEVYIFSNVPIDPHSNREESEKE